VKLQERIVRAERPQAGRPQAEGGWTFLSNYAHVLLMIAANPEARMRDLAEQVGITERAIHRIVDDLASGGYLRIFKLGRRNRYEVQTEMRLRHPAEAHRSIGELVKFVAQRPRTVTAATALPMPAERQAV
jgi:DNA-binding IclR family transcriptional regulator